MSLRRYLVPAICGMALIPAAMAADRDDEWHFCPPNTPTPLLTPAGPDDDNTRMSADSAETRDDIYILEGNAVVSRGEQQLSGDTLMFNREEGWVDARGNIHYVSPDLEFHGDHGRVYPDTVKGKLYGIDYTLPQQHGRGRAETVHIDDRQHQRLEQASYTTCPPGNNDWRLSADEVTFDHTDGTGVAEHATFSVHDVPVLYLPWITFPINDRRKSGFLIPRFGHSQESGYETSVPYYLNLAPNYDATLTPRIMSKRGLMLGGEFRYLTGINNGQISGEYLPSDNEFDDQNRSLVAMKHRGHPLRRMDTRIDASRVSDKEYFTDLGDNLVSSSKTHLRQQAEAAWHGHGWTLDGRALNFQTVDPTIASDDRPYKLLPRVRFTADPRQKWHGLRFGLDSELSKFDRDSSITGTRIDLQPRITLPLRSTAWFLQPSAGVRYTRYRLDNTDPGEEDNPDRTTPVFSVDSGTFFDRNFQWGKADLLQTLEPRLFYLNVPNKGQDDIPVFDTGDYDFNFWQLFTENRFTGPDRMGDANQLAVALTTRVLDPASGRQQLRASLGNLFYFRDRKVTLPGEVMETDNSSDIIGEVHMAFGRHWNAGTEILWNPGETHTSRYDALLQYKVNDRQLLNLSYRYRRDILKQTDVSFLWPLGDAWHLVGRWNYSLDDDETLEAVAGIGYESCCWNVQFIGRSFVNDEDGDRNTAMFLQVELKGLTSLGSQVDSVLERGILGYHDEY
ncbi:MAG: LPS assembly protein LptD [Pseudomonadota bacterium]